MDDITQFMPSHTVTLLILPIIQTLIRLPVYQAELEKVKKVDLAWTVDSACPLLRLLKLNPKTKVGLSRLNLKFAKNKC